MPSELECGENADGVRIGPVYVRRRTTASALSDIKSALASGAGLSVAFANTHLLYCALRDPRYAAGLALFYLLNDGLGVEALAHCASGRGFAENLNGTDFVPLLLGDVPAETRIYLVGASDRVSSAAAATWKAAFPALGFVGARDGYQGADLTDREVVEDIKRAAPGIVLVAMGNPRQEMWISACRELIPGPVYIGVGALFDYASDNVPRAPAIVRAARAEWLYRLIREPLRLWRRYTIEVYVVFAHVLRQKAANFVRAPEPSSRWQK